MLICEKCGLAYNTQPAHEKLPIRTVIGGGTGVVGAAVTGAWFLVPVSLFTGAIADFAAEDEEPRCSICGGPLAKEKAYRAVVRQEETAAQSLYIWEGNSGPETYALDDERGVMVKVERPKEGIVGKVTGAVGGLIGKAGEIVGKTAGAVGKGLGKAAEKVQKGKKS
ncbi:hypothetical protein HYR54_15230 [Candidatus Acetothermia bacterium]|nr:hypothetical protein [Candidatus Acetothermia bacterium]